MRIMVTGDQGYIGAVLVPMLMNKEYEVIGYDTGFFSENLLKPLEEDYKKIKKDMSILFIEDLKCHPRQLLINLV